jgi:LuxR family transcriptional regulator, maltose regulon positive regulatory protein
VSEERAAAAMLPAMGRDDLAHPTGDPGWRLPPGKRSPPRVHDELLPRPRLCEELEALARHAVTVVTGPAGAGKSIAVAQWLSMRGHAYAWVGIDEAEADPATLVRHVLGALVGSGCVPEPRAWPLAHEAIDARAWWIEHVVLPLSGEGPPVVLVLDDVQALAEPAAAPAAKALAGLVRDRPTRLRLVLVGQRLPPLPLLRLEAAGAVGRLPTATLWLTADESRALVPRWLGAAASAERCAALHERSGGWPAALRLMALAAATPAAEQAPSRAIELVIEEVVDRQAPELRAVLLDTAVLDVITPDAAAAVSGRPEASEALGRLCDAGLLVAMEQGAGLRALPLLREALVRRLEPAHRRGLHARASRHLAAQGHLDPAIAHAEAAGDGVLLTELATAHGLPLLRARRMGQLARLLAAIDEPTRRASPLLTTLEAWAALRQHPAAAHEALARARAVVARLDEASPPRATLMASLAALGTFVALRRGQVPDDLDARLADDAELPSGLAVALAVAAGLVAERSGDPARALTRFDRAVRLALAATPPLPSGLTALAHRVRVLRRAGEADEAHRAVERGRAAIERHGWQGLPVAAELALELAMLELDAGRPEAAEAGVVAGLHALRLGDDPAAIARGLLGLAMIRRARGDHEGAADAAAQAEATARDAGIPPLVAAARSLLDEPPAPIPAVPRTGTPATAEPISARELEVLRLVAQGLPNQVVARRLFIAPVTVKTHVHNILTKLAARNRTEAVHRARSLGLLT